MLLGGAGSYWPRVIVTLTHDRYESANNSDFFRPDNLGPRWALPVRIWPLNYWHDMLCVVSMNELRVSGKVIIPMGRHGKQTSR
jgi:hypothetical protein